MPDSPEVATPTHRKVLVVGRPGAGPVIDEHGNRANGGIAFFDGGKDVRAEPGDVVDVPVKFVTGYLSEGLVVDPESEED